MKRSAQKLNALFAISNKVSSDYDLQELLDFIISKAVKVLKATTGSLMLIEPRTNRLIMRSVIGLRADVVKTMKLKVGEGVTGQCALHGRPLLIKDTTKDKYYIEAVPGTLSELAVPLIIEGGVIGVINLDSDRLCHFTKQDMKLLTAFASWAALAIKMKQMESKQEELQKFIEA